MIDASYRPKRAARDIAQIAVFAGLIAALGLPLRIQFSWMNVPITFQSLGVMLAGAILGARKGFLAVLVFDVLVAAGLPLLAGARGGIAFLTTAPTAGYPYGFLLAAGFIGWGTAKILPRYPLWKGFLITAFGGMVLIYLVGVPILAINAHLDLWTAIARGTLPFLPGDALKVVVTVLIAQQVHRAYPGLIASRARRGDALSAGRADLAPTSRPGENNRAAAEQRNEHV